MKGRCVIPRNVQMLVARNSLAIFVMSVRLNEIEGEH